MTSAHSKEIMRDSLFDLPLETLMKRLKQEKYFHDFAFDEVRTGSLVYGDKLPTNYHLWPVLRYLGELDLKGARCLDIGSYDGLTAFVMAEHGAGRVDATCQYDLQRFRLIRAIRRYEAVAYHPQTDIARIASEFEPAQFDVVVISAMLHHLTSPLEGLLEARRQLKRDGYFVCESIFIDRPEAALLLNSELEDPVFGAPTLFVPTLPALRGMLRLAGFEIVSETRLLGGAAARETNHERVTFLARARRPSEIPDRTAKTEEFHAAGLKLGSLALAKIEADDAPPSAVRYSGPAGPRTLNIWLDQIEAPLQPAPQAYSLENASLFSIGRERRFLRLAAEFPDGEFSWDDVFLLAARYPGETMPEGMAWGLKQLGNLHALEHVRKFGASRVLEVGPGFNFYMPNHLPSWCSYACLDASGFYDDGLLATANKSRGAGEFFEGLLGKTEGILAPESFDACISMSVLEHVPAEDISAVCRDMFRILRRGGWAIHSIDLNEKNVARDGRVWLDELRAAGFEIEDSGVDRQFGGERNEVKNDPPVTEPLSIRARFWNGYQKTIWGVPNVRPTKALPVTILVVARKPISPPPSA